jgi:hypothetical protein
MALAKVGFHQLHWRVERAARNYKTAISACRKGREWQLVLGGLSTMTHATAESHHSHWGVTSHQLRWRAERNTPAAFNACTKGREWQLALRVKMERNTVAAVSACAKGREWKFALRVKMARNTVALCQPGGRVWAGGFLAFGFYG